MPPDQYHELVLKGVFAAGFAVCTTAAIVAWRRGQATASRGCAIAFVWGFFVLCGAVMYPIFRSAQQEAENIICLENMQHLGVALIQYAQDHNEHLPPASAWATDIMPYLSADDKRKAFHCPYAGSPYSYAFNKALGGASMDKIANPSSVVMLFECDAKTVNAIGSAADLCRPRHAGSAKLNFAFADGHIKGENNSEISTLNWKR